MAGTSTGTARSRWRSTTLAIPTLVSAIRLGVGHHPLTRRAMAYVDQFDDWMGDHRRAMPEPATFRLRL
jgi:hypothetical protein